MMSILAETGWEDIPKNQIRPGEINSVSSAGVEPALRHLWFLDPVVN